MKQKIWKLIGDVALSALVATTATAVIVAYVTVDEMKAENEQLKQENAELQMDYINLEIDYENIRDAYWQLNNQLEREQE
ncbi:hypothetical protein [Oceanobacillus locisalsi]|uniref:TMhelix containing protein n=1 Tax=Oceanobacillus locisalsi TaxID=546107 RepID=A0ABW3NGA9_9BACI